MSSELKNVMENREKGSVYLEFEKNKTKQNNKQSCAHYR